MDSTAALAPPATARRPRRGEFESAYLYLFTISRGRIARIGLFELEQLDAALARFEELRAAGR